MRGIHNLKLNVTLAKLLDLNTIEFYEQENPKKLELQIRICCKLCISAFITGCINVRVLSLPELLSYLKSKS